MTTRTAVSFAKDHFLSLDAKEIFGSGTPRSQGEPSALESQDPEIMARLQGLWSKLAALDQRVRMQLLDSHSPDVDVEQLNVNRLLAQFDVCSMWLLCFSHCANVLDAQFVEDRLRSIDVLIQDVSNWMDAR